jgi:ADP-ribose pyrophosphatase YjhB (NUDIX family)
MAARPLVGVAIWISHPHEKDTYLLGHRIGSHGANTWATPGGHLELGEEPAKCAAREAEEETGLDINEHSCSIVGVTNDIFPAQGDMELKHYVTIFMKGAVRGDGTKEPKVSSTILFIDSFWGISPRKRVSTKFSTFVLFPKVFFKMCKQRERTFG